MFEHCDEQGNVRVNSAVWREASRFSSCITRRKIRKFDSKPTTRFTVVDYMYYGPHRVPQIRSSL